MILEKIYYNGKKPTVGLSFTDIKSWWQNLRTEYKYAIIAGVIISIVLIAMPTHHESELERLMKLKLESELLEGKK